jgi:iron complex outermembrane receptor protein
VNLGVRQTVRMGGFKLTGDLNTQYKSDRYIGSDYLPHQRVGDTWTSNFDLALSPEEGGWTLGAFVRNIENDRVPVTAPVFSAGGLTTVVTTAPRTYGLRASASF